MDPMRAGLEAVLHLWVRGDRGEGVSVRTGTWCFPGSAGADALCLSWRLGKSDSFRSLTTKWRQDTEPIGRHRSAILSP